ncbi:hypothetical protein PIB30_080889, partial [Stylosanthes scabra]|nr:hypothetical protein [Stylosanthes scabra]
MGKGGLRLCHPRITRKTAIATPHPRRFLSSLFLLPSSSSVILSQSPQLDHEFSMDDPSPLLEAANDFATHPGVQSDDSVKDFLNRFPLPLIINALQTEFDVPGLENTIVACLERLFKTKLGASLIPQYM